VPLSGCGEWLKVMRFCYNNTEFLDARDAEERGLAIIVHAHFTKGDSPVSKAKVKRKLPNSYCIRQLDPESPIMRFVVWPTNKPVERHQMACAIGTGRTPAEAWACAYKVVRSQS